VAQARSNPKFTLVEADLLNADLDAMCTEADGVFHLAAQPGVRGSWGDSFIVYNRDNILATQRLFEAAAGAGRRVVFSSSSSVYGNARRFPIREDADARPISPYGVTKLMGEQLAHAYAVTRGLSYLCVRYFSVYGPRQRPDMAFHRIIEALFGDGTFVIHGTGEQRRDFTFVGDAVDATLRAMDSRAEGRAYNVGGGSEASLAEVIELVESLAGRRLMKSYAASAGGDVERTSADTRRAESELGWRPRTTLRQGVSRQLDWAVSRERTTRQRTPSRS
jgi:nucleoside-diphosphate-sugar epimerase